MSPETLESKPPKPEDASPRSRSWISSAKDPDYWQALGEFIEAFASAETLLFNYVAIAAGITNSTAKALLSGLHADQIIDCVRKVWEVLPPNAEIKAKVEDALVQFKIINGVRNSIVHYVSFVTSDKGRVSSNITRALTAGRLREFRVSPVILREMIADLEKINAHVLYALNILVEPHTSRDHLVRDLPALTTTWVYKPTQDDAVLNQRRKRRDRA